MFSGADAGFPVETEIDSRGAAAQTLRLRTAGRGNSRNSTEASRRVFASEKSLLNEDNRYNQELPNGPTELSRESQESSF